MSTPPSSPRPSPFDDLPNPLEYPLPPGTYTLLPIVEVCDNVELPHGPWEARDCKRRWERHSMKTIKLQRRESANNVNSSALDDDEEEEDEGEVAEKTPKTASEFDREFLCPLFLQLPSDPSMTPIATSTSQSRRNSSHSISRPSFTRLTPMPSLRPSSPTSSHPAFSQPASPPSTEPIVSQPIGFLRPSIVKALVEDNRKMISINCRPVWSFLPPIHFPPPVRRQSSSRSRPSSRRSSHSVHPMTTSRPGTPGLIADGLPATPNAEERGQLNEVIEGLRTIAASASRSDSFGENGNGPNFSKGPFAVGFEDWVNEEGPETRKEHVDRLMRNWKGTGQFNEVLGGWRDELYNVYGPPARTDNPLPGSNIAFTMERSACSLFGVTTFGVHCTAYVEEEGQPLKLWVPRRSATKQTWPSYLDNTVAGGITAGDSPRESIIRECAEEASLPPAYVAQHIKAVGCVVYHYRTVDGYIQPEVQYTYDLPLPAKDGPTPTTNPDDGEVESFELMTLEQVLKRMVDGEFKPNCALVLVDFLTRHGYLSPETDSRYLEVVTRLRRPMVLPAPA